MDLKDVVVIGAGAAGSSAAFHLATAGKKVSVVERNLHPSIKSCGGGMAASVQQWFPFDLTPIIEEVIARVEFSWCLSDQIIAELPGSSPFWIVKREKMDEFLMQKAVEKGAELIRPFNVIKLQKENEYWITSSEEGEQITSKAVVIADGSKSRWTNPLQLGPKRVHYASTSSVRLEGKGLIKPKTSRFEFGLVHHGFAWAFPLKDGVNIGIGTFIGNQQLDNKKILDQLLPHFGFSPDEGKRKSTSLRVWNGHSSLHNDGVVVVGDAASLCDPFLAEGLRPALLSGYEAARCINLWFDGTNKDLSEYTKIMKEKWGDSMAWGRRISQVFYRFPKIGYQLGIKRPTAPKRIAQILSGEMAYGDIAQRVIKRLILQR